MILIGILYDSLSHMKVRCKVHMKLKARLKIISLHHEFSMGVDSSLVQNMIKL